MRSRLFRGDALAVLPTLPAAAADLLLVDPPYSSGGLMLHQRSLRPNDKYADNRTPWQDFSGDQRDQWSWLQWCAVWLGQCRRILRPVSYALVFTDWRQLGATIAAVQLGGFLFRGVIAWDKGRGSRPPHLGAARQQCEFIVWATPGDCPRRAPGTGGPFDGFLSVDEDGEGAGAIHEPVVRREKRHMTAKPIALMRRLIGFFCPEGGTVLDPFAGSAPDALVCHETGRTWWGVECVPHYADVAEERLRGVA